MSRSQGSRAPRFHAALVAVLESPSGDLECEALDLSRTGALLEGGLPANLGDPVTVRIRSRAGDLEGRFAGKIARIEPDSDGGGQRIGVEFTGLGPEQGRILESLLGRLMEGLNPGSLQSLRPGAPSHEIRKALEAIPLAHRIALAARGGPREREILRHDMQPQVLESLARNPNLLQSEALSLASNPQTISSTLEVLAADPRWAADWDIRVHVASHPRVPVALAERIVAGLPASALRKALARPSLLPALRDRILKRIVRG